MQPAFELAARGRPQSLRIAQFMLLSRRSVRFVVKHVTTS
jgi:hypothetical protein